VLSSRDLFAYPAASVLLLIALVLAACTAPAAPAEPVPESVEAPAAPIQQDLDAGELDAETDEELQVEPGDTDTGEVLTEETGDELPPATADGAPSTPVHVQLFMSQPPAVGEQAEIVMEVRTVEDAPEVTAEIELPPGVEVVSGETSWTGSLRAGEAIEFSAAIVFTEPGEYGISAVALAPINPDMIYGDNAAVFLTVGEDGSSFGLESGSDPQLDVSENP
jgi:hypothetical protein